MKSGAEKRLAASAQRCLIPSAFNLLASILSMHYRRDGFSHRLTTERDWKRITCAQCMRPIQRHCTETLRVALFAIWRLSFILQQHVVLFLLLLLLLLLFFCRVALECESQEAEGSVWISSQLSSRLVGSCRESLSVVPIYA